MREEGQQVKIKGINDVLGGAVAMRLLAGPRPHFEAATAITNVDTYRLSAEDFKAIMTTGQTPLTHKLIVRTAVRMLFRRIIKRVRRGMRYNNCSGKRLKILKSSEYPGTREVRERDGNPTLRGAAWPEMGIGFAENGDSPGKPAT